jgi:hypothetical protein
VDARVGPARADDADARRDDPLERVLDDALDRPRAGLALPPLELRPVVGDLFY